MASKQFMRLSTNYFWYFGLLGLIVPFLSVFLDARGFTSLEIGEILAVITATKIVAPSLWAQLADKSGQHLRIVKVGALLSLLCFSLIIWTFSYWPLMFSLAMFSLFITSILPQIEVMTLNSIRKSAKIYARIRLWGSIGFVIVAMLSGELIERYSAEAFSYIGMVILAGLFISTLLNKQPRIAKKTSVDNVTIKAKVFNRNFLLFFFAGLMLQMSFGPYYVFFALYLKNLAYSGFLIGIFIAIGVVAEIGVFVFAAIFFKSFSLKTLISMSILLTAFRWFIVGHFANSDMALAFSQLIHALSFGLYHSASISFIQQHFNANQQSRGQAIYIGGVYGVGGAIGAYVAGLLWQEGIGAVITFDFAAITALIGGILALFLRNKPIERKVSLP
ncbi:MFS transporter [Colwellia sp. MB3u-70]|uniref:MFS transporter n=1 Tax=unclassified Colwellia TaxID=196834 RepID=UPI0015F53361|nr:MULTISPECIES: MFS transporter [unclassified Colwellia]MBA6292616.1 MFS transporter [Colwellia sp. MB3u-8]MBA6307411.1 MFS transporter [Colwellia sp. MB3u-70]